MEFDISLSKPHLRRELEADMKECVENAKKNTPNQSDDDYLLGLSLAGNHSMVSEILANLA